MQGHHLYRYDSQSSQWQYVFTSEPQGIKSNGYYCYHDGQFFADDNNHTHTNWFLVTTWQLNGWPPYGTTIYDRGIYLIDDGDIMDDRVLITGTEDKTYGKIYRDLVDPQVFYTWYSEVNDATDFQRIEVTGTLGSGFSIAPPGTPTSDFDVTGYDLTSVKAFYQYLEDGPPPVVHQYLLTGDDTSPDPIYDVWHRDDSGGSLEASGWNPIMLDVAEYLAMGEVAWLSHLR